MNLPIEKYKSELVDALREYETLIVVGDTGSGKTTQIPKYILQSFDYKIVVTQPRRIAALEAAKRVSKELDEKLGDLIGFKFRFDQNVTDKTRITYMTDGTLVRLLQSKESQNIAGKITKISKPPWDVIVVDEAHERSLDTDILFAVLRRIQKSTGVKIVIMSATLDIEKVSRYFGEAPVFSVPGRMWQVDIYYQSLEMNYKEMKKSYLERAIETVKTIHNEEGEGDILVFLTGQQEIETAIRSLREEFQEERVELIPIYSSLESLEQNRVFEVVKGKRKVIISTNIAQTSVTVPNVRFVVDSGFVKQKMYDPNTHMDALVVTPISQAAATQRAGRAGRTMNGKVYRLYSKDFFMNMDQDTVPEIQRSSLIGTVLTLKKMGIHDVLNFDFIDPPEPDLILAAVKDLFLLGAVDQDGHLTHLGLQIVDFPISPFLSRALVSSSVDFHCSFEFLTIAAMLSVEDVFVSPRSKKKQAVAEHTRKKFHHITGDHLTLLNVYQAWKDHDCSKDWCFDNFIHYRAIRNAERVRSQLLDIMDRLRLHIHPCVKTKRGAVDHNPILKALCTSYYVHAGKKHPQRPYYYPYLSVAGNHEAISSNMMALYIGPQSSLFSESPDWVIYNDIQFVNRAQMRVVSRIDFSMVSVLLGRVKLMDLAKLSGTSTVSIESAWAVNDDSEEIGPSHCSSQGNLNHLEFERVEEYIDELNQKEIIHTKDGDFEFEHHASPSAKREEQVDQDKERDRKREEYRQRYLKRKKT